MIFLVLWVFIFSLLAGSLFARTHFFPYRDSTFFGGRVGDAQMVANLNGAWESDVNRTFEVPFCSDDYSRLELRREFFLSAMPQDTMLLYFEGVMWSAEVYVNDRLMYLIRHPFREHLFKLPPNVLNAQWNKLKVIVSKKGGNVADAPVRMVGIHKPVYLFANKTANSVPALVIFPKVVQSANTLVYIPFSEKFGYNLEPRKVLEDFRLIKAAGVEAVYFPYSPSKHTLAIMARMGLKLQLQPTERIAYYRRIQYRFTTIGNEHRAWFDEDGRKTIHFGKFESFHEESPFFDWNREKSGLVIMMMIPLLLIVFWKAVNDRTFRLMLHLPNLNFNHNEVIRGGTTVGTTIIYFNALLRITLTASLAVMIILFLKAEQKLGYLDIFTDYALLRKGIELTGGRILILFAVLVLFLSACQFMRSFLMNVLSFIYNKTDMNARILIIENCADLPFLIFLAYAIFVFLLSSVSYYAVLLPVALFLVLLFLLRKYWRTFVMMDNVLRMPLFVNFVYICVLDWLPWVMLL